MEKQKRIYKAVPLEVSAQIRVLHQMQELSVTEIQKLFPTYHKTTIYRHMKKPIGDIKPDQRKTNKGRPVKLNHRNERLILRSLYNLRKTVGTYSSQDIQRDCGMQATVHNRTIRRILKKHGFGDYQCRKKGQLTEEDFPKRLKFARKCKRLPQNFWTEGISFYLDGTGWAHKLNPHKQAKTNRTRMWRKRGEGLTRECLAKGKKEGTGCRMAKFMVAIAHGKGVIKCHHYVGNVNGEMCAEFIREQFPEMFEKGNNLKGKLFLQDGDPSQNSRLANDAMEEVPCRLFKIPPRSPDLNPIENIFKVVGDKLRKDALEKGIEKETYEQFCFRVKKTLMKYPTEAIDRTIESMVKRIDAVIKSRGNRTKY